jgi:hypothetical protein
MMRAFTVRDTRTYHPHSISLINLQSTTFNQLQAHPARGDIAVASYLGLLGDDNRIRDGLAEADRAPSGSVMTIEEWTEREAEFRRMGLSDDQIADIRRAIGPRDAGLAALAGVDPVVLALGRERTLVERAAIFDASELRRITLADAYRGMLDRGEPTAAAAVDAAQRQAEGLGIEDISVTWAFPIAVAAFGYTRVASKRGEGRLRGFARQGAYEGRIPIFAVATETEAIILTLSARQVLKWLIEAGIYAGSEAVDEQAARQEVLGIFARQETDPAPANALTVLVHTMSHILLRALDDGQVGFAEASLAEWIVPETLTFALYANNLKSYTLGALWTLLNNRSLQWLERTADSVLRCENDPLCYQRSPRACERCLFLTFGCQRFNDQLDRQLLSDFWRRA